ncbi:hypothetical protein HHI36_001998 [Cryptolaemus montrouzieri]|uniref:Uncharacterized protein n=1 Tax=Cryptolaemus montrouzieri TaxID=559131 RepID=A0ABD2P9N2_9CUCU
MNDGGCVILTDENSDFREASFKTETIEGHFEYSCTLSKALKVIVVCIYRRPKGEITILKENVTMEFLNNKVHQQDIFDAEYRQPRTLKKADRDALFVMKTLKLCTEENMQQTRKNKVHISAENMTHILLGHIVLRSTEP